MTDEYKQKYDDLMKRCAKFMSEFAPPSPYELGFKAGWEAAKQEFHKDNTYVPDTTKPARTMDIQWPRDYENLPPRTISPKYNDHSIPCHTCHIDLAKQTSYVCHQPNCPSQIKPMSLKGI
jgi:hypothetical protein